MFIRTLKVKTYKTMTSNDIESDLGYLTKLVDEYNNSYHCSVGIIFIDADYSGLTETKLNLILC